MGGGGGLGGGQRDAEDRVGAELALCSRCRRRRSWRRSSPTWSVGSRPTTTLASASLTLATALVTPLAEVAFLVAVAELDRLVRAGAGAGRDGGAAERSRRPGSRRPRRSGCLGCPGSRGRGLGRSGEGMRAHRLGQVSWKATSSRILAGRGAGRRWDLATYETEKTNQARGGPALPVVRGKGYRQLLVRRGGDRHACRLRVPVLVDTRGRYGHWSSSTSAARPARAYGPGSRTRGASSPHRPEIASSARSRMAEGSGRGRNVPWTYALSINRDEPEGRSPGAIWLSAVPCGRLDAEHDSKPQGACSATRRQRYDILLEKGRIVRSNVTSQVAGDRHFRAASGPGGACGNGLADRVGDELGRCRSTEARPVQR